MANNNFESMLTGLTTALGKYVDLGTQQDMTQKQEIRKSNLELEKGKQLNQQQAQLDLAGKSALEAYKQTLEGKLDPETAGKLHPEAAAAVESFYKENHRYPNLGKEADTLLKPFEVKNQNNRQDSLDRQRKNSAIQKHVSTLMGKSMPTMVNTYNKLKTVFETGKNVEGIGLGESYIPNFLLGDKGKDNRSNLQQLSNTLLNMDSGQAVTDGEYRRFLNKIYAGKMPDEQAVRMHLSKIGSDLKKFVETSESSLDPEYLSDYYTRKNALKSEDIKLFDPMKKADSPAVAPAPSGGGWSIRPVGKK